MKIQKSGLYRGVTMPATRRLSPGDNPDDDRGSDEDEAELAVGITAALAASGCHRPATAAAGRRGGVPARLPADDPVAAASVAQSPAHRHRLTLHAGDGALDQRPRPRSGGRHRLTARLSFDHLVLGTVSVQPTHHHQQRFSDCLLITLWRAVHRRNFRGDGSGPPFWSWKDESPTL